MGFKLSNAISDLNSAMYPSPDKNTANLVSPFGGEAAGFAKGVSELYSKNFYTSSAKPDAATVAKGMQTTQIASSMANKYALFNYQGFYGNLETSQKDNFVDVPDNPLMGGNNATNVSLPKIINYFETNYPKISYKPSDFLYSKYYKKIPVNHLITLRRFPTPITDNIYKYKIRPKDAGDESKGVDATQVAGVTAITYLGETAGNKLEDILQMSFGLAYKELTAEMESVDTGGAGGGYTQQPFYNKIGGIGRAIADSAKGQTAGSKFRAQNGAGSSTADRLGTTYANFVLGPVNVVNTTVIRDRGIKFSNDMKLTFEYELKSLSYINPKIAMIDIISNMLTMTTNNGQFFGGGHRYYGSGGYVASQFGDISLLRNGQFGAYMGSVVNDVETGMKGLFGDANGNFDANSIVDGLKQVGKTLLGNMLGSFLGSQVGGQTGTTATKAFISGEPTGDWHVTVGNPLNPIVMMGNMYCDNATMTLGQGLGYDDFPMEVKFEIDMKHGKPRDKGDIENMFNAGQGRIYASALNVEDVLNLSGKEVAVYGTIPDVGTSSLQPSTNQPPADAFNNELIGNLSSNDKATSSIKSGSANQDPTTGEYISNLTQMLIDS